MISKSTDPWVEVRAYAKDKRNPDVPAKEVRNLLADADKLRKVALAAEDMLEPGQIWSVDPSKLKNLRDLVEALPKRLRDD